MKAKEFIKIFLPKSKFARSVSILVGGTSIGTQYSIQTRGLNLQHRNLQ